MFGWLLLDGQVTASPKDVDRWALYKTVQKANGDDEQVPIGDGCEKCWAGWNSNHKEDAESFEEHCDRFHNDKKYKKKVVDAEKVSAGEMVAHFNKEEALRETMFEIAVRRRYTVLNDEEMKRYLKEPRLSKAAVKPLSTMTVPSEADPGTDEVVYCFLYDASAPYRFVEVTSANTVKSSKELLSKSACAWAGQGDTKRVKQTALESDRANLSDPQSKMYGNYMYTLSDFAEAHSNRQKSKAISRRRSRNFAGGAEDEDEEQEENTEDDKGDDNIQGIAAHAMLAGESDSGGTPVHAKRPPAPLFEESPAKYAKTTSAENGNESTRSPVGKYAASSAASLRAGGNFDNESEAGDDDGLDVDEGVLCVTPDSFLVLLRR